MTLPKVSTSRKPLKPWQERIAELESALRQARPIVEYVSKGRGYIGVGPYPDATARRVNAQIQEVLDV